MSLGHLQLERETSETENLIGIMSKILFIFAAYQWQILVKTVMFFPMKKMDRWKKD
jgi:hypothetical protein